MGVFVAIEGLDGVGKTTVVQQLAERFSGHALSTPGRALRDSRKPVLEAFAEDELAKALFYTASVSSQGRLAHSLAERGEWVFVDRYWASTLAYAKARGVTADLDQLGRSLIQPDLTILLILDEPERQRRLHKRGATIEDIETLDPKFRQCVLEELRAHANLIVNLSFQEPQAACSIIAQAIRDQF
ncbi:AAA family ATPase [Halomonas sp. Bachu 37]|uniref:dTMP kinase n=1 Tax=Halomonas kashgarensis TaxID=3084920 RepID=UPI003217A6D8